jgi:hypothetical protein
MSELSNKRDLQVKKLTQEIVKATLTLTKDINVDREERIHKAIQRMRDETLRLRWFRTA